MMTHFDTIDILLMLYLGIGAIVATASITDPTIQKNYGAGTLVISWFVIIAVWLPLLVYRVVLKGTKK